MAATRWLTMKEAAELAGVSPRTMRNRLVALNAEHGGRLLRSFGTGGVVRRWHVHPKVLARVLEPDEATELERLDVASLRDEQEQQRLMLQVLARRNRALARRVAELEARLPVAAE